MMRSSCSFIRSGILGLSLLLPWAGPVQAGSPFQQHYETALSLYNAGRYDEAVKEFAGLFPAGAVDEGEAELVHGVHEDAVLVVHSADVDGASVVPG